SAPARTAVPAEVRSVTNTAMAAAATATNEKARSAAAVPYDVLIKHWPNFRGPYGQGNAYGATPVTSWDGKAGRNIRWKTPVALEGKSSPIVWGSKVFVTGSDGTKRALYCYNADTGTQLWQQSDTFGAEVEASDDTGYAASTPAVDGERVYAIYASGELIAVDMGGKKIWSRSFGVPENNYGYSSSLIVHRYLFVQIDSEAGGVLYALDTASGKTVWSKQRKFGASWSSPIIVVSGGREAVVLTANPAVVAYSVADGSIVFSHACLSGEVAPSAGFSRGIIVAGAEFSALTAMSFPGGVKKWASEDDLPNASSALASGQFVVTLNASGAANCYDIATGKKLWHQEFDAEFYASPVSAGGNVYCTANDGTAKTVKLGAEFAEAGSGSLGERSSSTPAIVGTRIFARGDKHLFCIGQ
ncbi:MAG: PQQ-binding-like beta-propeller repeat protein, partial [Spirochaetota bacterium]